MANPPPANSSTKLLVQAGPNGADVYIDPPLVRTAGQLVQKRLIASGHLIDAFATNAKHQEGEFGRLPLPEVHQANDQYAQHHQLAVGSLTTLALELFTAGALLTAVADEWDLADSGG